MYVCSCENYEYRMQARPGGQAGRILDFPLLGGGEGLGATPSMALCLLLLLLPAAAGGGAEPPPALQHPRRP